METGPHANIRSVWTARVDDQRRKKKRCFFFSRPACTPVERATRSLRFAQLQLDVTETEENLRVQQTITTIATTVIARHSRPLDEQCYKPRSYESFSGALH